MSSTSLVAEVVTITYQLHPFRLPGVIWEPGRHLMEILAGGELQRGKGHAGPLLDFGHHHTLLEGDLFCLMVGDCQLLLQH